VILYTCGQKKAHAAIGHPCGRAAKALDAAVRDLIWLPAEGKSEPQTDMIAFGQPDR